MSVPPRAPGRYPLRNDAGREAERLESLQSLRDASTIRALERLGVGPGWHCAELGAGAGSIAQWMADRVGDRGSVTAVDRDTNLLGALADRTNVSVETGDLMTMDFGAARFDLVHSRAVLMHLDDPDGVVARVLPALRPGGVVLFEESDGAPAQAATTTPAAALALGLPAPFLQVMVPLADRWTWARGLAARLAAQGLVDVRDHVRVDVLRGATPGAAFWNHTLESIRPLLTDGDAMEALGRRAVEESSVDDMLALLQDPAFTAPFLALHQVSGRRP